MSAHGTDLSAAAPPQAVRRSLTTNKIVILIIATMTPLSAFVGTVPLGLAFGGPGLVWSYVLAGIIIAIFCVGYVQMVQRISRPGAFYNYIARGLGRPTGVAGALIGAASYPVGLIATSAVQAFVAHETLLAIAGWDVPWQLLMVVQVIIVGLLTWRQIDVSALAISVIVACEVGMILLLAVGLLAKHGGSALPMDVWRFDSFGMGSGMVAFVFAILCYQGYEAAALYTPEAKNPEKTVPRALYAALIILTVVCVLGVWALIGTVGRDSIGSAVTDAQFSGFVFGAVQATLGKAGLYVFGFLAIVAQFACLVGITNFMSRYLNGLAKDDVLPRWLSKDNRHGSPGNAIILLLGLGVVVPFVCDWAGIDPYTQLAAVGFGIGALAATTLQMLASAAVVLYFRNNPDPSASVLKTRVAPAVATVLLAAALVVEIKSFELITGNPEPWASLLPWVLPILFVAGLVYGYWLRTNRPLVYADIAVGDSAEDAALRREQRRSLIDAVGHRARD